MTLQPIKPIISNMVLLGLGRQGVSALELLAMFTAITPNGLTMGYYEITIAAAAVCLAPLVLYLFGRIRDPFHPLLIVGATAFACACYIPLTNPEPALEFTTRGALADYELITLLSVAAFYWGWLWRSKRSPETAPVKGSMLTIYRDEYSPQRMVAVAWVYALISAAVAYHYYGHIHSSGYVTNLVFLEWPAAIFFIQAAILDRNFLPVAVIGIPLAMTESLLRFFLYGSRFEVAVAGSLALLPFLSRGTRPRKALFLVAAFGLAIVVWSMTTTRLIMAQHEANNRLSALVVAVEQLFAHQSKPYTAGKTFVFGANVVRVAKETHFGNGDFIYNLGVRFLPHEWFPEKYSLYTDWSQTGDIKMVRNHLGMSSTTMPNGAACSAFASVFTQFGWLFPLPWFLLGIWVRHIYGHAVFLRRFNFQAFLVMAVILMFLFIGQDIYQFVLYGLFGFVPTLLGYRYCRTAAFRLGRSVAAAGGSAGPNSGGTGGRGGS